MRRLTALLIALALFFGMGVYLPILQSAAWVGMTIKNLHTAPLKTALQKTFDGKHDCNICKGIAKIYHAEKKDLKKSLAQSPRFTDFYHPVSLRFLLSQNAWLRPSWAAGMASMPKSLVVPPPKHLLS